MGTRNLTFVVLDGQFKVAQYGQWDGYPSGQGATILAFLRGTIASGRLEAFTQKVRAARFGSAAEIDGAYKAFSKDGMMTTDQAADFKKSAHGHLSRDTGGNILSAVLNRPAGIMLQDEYAFAGDSLFCEWAYVVDLDERVLEVYRGFNTERLSKGERFAHLNKSRAGFKPRYEGHELHQPIKLLHSYRLDALPDEDTFVSELDRLASPPDEIEEMAVEDADADRKAAYEANASF